MTGKDLRNARKLKNDEFYTQYPDIEKQINAYLEFNSDVFKNKVILCPCDDPEWSNFTKYFAQNFEKLKLKKLISTSYAYESKSFKGNYKITDFEKKDRKFDAKKTKIKGKIYVVEKDRTGDRRINIDDVDWEYLEGDGDFRSKEVINLRNETDFIITNPPFSLFSEFIKWILDANKKFIIIGNINAIPLKEVFPLIKENRIWLGYKSFRSREGFFKIPKEIYDDESLNGKNIFRDGDDFLRRANVCWYTNVEHGERYEKLKLITEKNNLKHKKALMKILKNKFKTEFYPEYENYEGIEIPLILTIPSDYDGLMGVPITFLEKYNPEQFEIIGIANGSIGERAKIKVDEEIVEVYHRIMIKHKKAVKQEIK